MKYTDEQIREIILTEYYQRSKGISTNPETHMYNFPELKQISNQDILPWHTDQAYRGAEKLSDGFVNPDKYVVVPTMFLSTPY